jgi:hypothetical protein
MYAYSYIQHSVGSAQVPFQPSDLAVFVHDDIQCLFFIQFFGAQELITESR